MTIVEKARQAVNEMLKVQATRISYLGGDLPLVHWFHTGESVTVKVLWLGQTFINSFLVGDELVGQVTEWISSIKGGTTNG